MKILLISDTHESKKELREILLRHSHEVEIVCHMGDHAWDLLDLQSEYPSLTMYAVAGNCDYGPGLSAEMLITAAGKKIFLTHGHNNGVKMGLDRLAYYARERGADACFFGHTHYPECTETGGVLMMNPGSPSWPRGGSKASYGMVEISSQGEIFGELVQFQWE